MELHERQELADELLAALERRGVSLDAGLLLDLTRVERELSHSLSVVRRTIEAIVSAGINGLNG